MLRSLLYLAGPEVFLPNATELAAEKKALCIDHGFEGLFPLDNAIDAAGLSPEAYALAIAAANEDLMRQADGIIANLTPYHGPSGDVGTAYEVGFMRALGKPIFAYTNVVADFSDRVVEYLRVPAHLRPDPYADGCAIEAFGLADNLMLERAAHASGSLMIRTVIPRGQELLALDGFEHCLRIARTRLGEVNT